MERSKEMTMTIGVMVPLEVGAALPDSGDGVHQPPGRNDRVIKEINLAVHLEPQN